MWYVRALRRSTTFIKFSGGWSSLSTLLVGLHFECAVEGGSAGHRKAKTDEIGRSGGEAEGETHAHAVAGADGRISGIDAKGEPTQRLVTAYGATGASRRL